MTNTCNSAQKANQLIAASVNVVVHSMFLHNHLRKFWVNNVLDYLTEFLRAHLNDSLDEVAPELHFSLVFMALARAFDKMFSLCAKYPRCLGEVFCQWIIDNHYGEILFHAERAASGGHQDVTSIALMELFWNRNYCVEFLD